MLFSRQSGVQLAEIVTALCVIGLLATFATPYLLRSNNSDAEQIQRQNDLQLAVNSGSIEKGLLPLTFGPGILFEERLNPSRVFNLEPSFQCQELANGLDIGTKAFELKDGTIIITNNTWDTSIDYDSTTPQQEAGREVCVLPKGEDRPEDSYIVRVVRESADIANLNGVEATGFDPTTDDQTEESEFEGSNEIDDTTVIDPNLPPQPLGSYVVFTRQAFAASESFSNLDNFLIATENRALSQVSFLFKRLTGKNLSDEFDLNDPHTWDPGVITGRIEQLEGKPFKERFFGRIQIYVAGVPYYYNADDMLYKIAAVREGRRIRAALGAANSMLANMNTQPAHKKFTLIASNGLLLAQNITWATFKSRITIKAPSCGGSATAAQFLATGADAANSPCNFSTQWSNYAYTADSAAEDWERFVKATREIPDLEVIYTATDKPGNPKYKQNGLTARYSPIKVALDENHAQLNSDHSFWVDLDGLKASKLPPIKTTGGLNMNEAWLVYDRDNNGLFSKDGELDGNDVFGDHMGRYKSGYEDLFSAFKSSVEVDEAGQKYIALNDLNWFEHTWISAGRFFGWDKTPNPSYDLHLLTLGKQTLPASKLVKRIYTDYKDVKEEDSAKENAILQRGKITYASGKSTESADMWFSASDFKDD
jgi:hypothetical protein